MNKTAYKVTYSGLDSAPEIVKVDFTDPEGVSWREAKKQLRSWYLAEAAKLRSIKEKDYFKHD